MHIIQISWDALQAEAAQYPMGVQLWMRVMMISFVSGIIFAPWKNGARWIVAALIINILGLIIIKAIYPEFSRTEIGTVIHLIFWSFAIAMIWKKDVRDARKTEAATIFNRIYNIWLIWASLVMVLSLLFDTVTAVKFLF